jgi:hypothetical protein
VPRAWICPSAGLARFHGTVFGIFGSFPLFSDFQLFSGLGATDGTLVVEVRIWCVEVGDVFALHLKSPHAQTMFLRIESAGRHTHHKQVKVVFYYKEKES